ncbi:SET domain-containing protein [Rhizoctonia solani AG-1 IA]|uniref:Histone-lysine N-methyltransferase SET5 n=1 Tax=Thanatephorus cucumeris (strain AG1-IA) TaxID=983506 RepID=L8WP40_THACA|nr:SET domain-containing protein [Rhizoctonia solani AG-1 IA]
MGVVPTDDELTSAVRSLRASNATLGVPKLLSALIASQPEWSVSEKRLRKIVQKLKNAEESNAYPTSSLNSALDVSKYSKKIKTTVFGEEKGKGLIAAQDIDAGEVLWREDPFVYAPPWEIYEAQMAGTACAYCSRAFTPTNPPLRVRCPHGEQSITAATPPTRHCRGTFCSRLCLVRSGSNHSLLCSVANPACLELLDLLEKERWKAALTFTQCVVRILSAWQDETRGGSIKDKGGSNSLGDQNLSSRDAIWDTYRSFATLRNDRRWSHTSENDLARSQLESTYKRLHLALVNAFYLAPTGDQEKEVSHSSATSTSIPTPSRSTVGTKQLKRLLRIPVPQEILGSLFSWDGLMEGLGKMNLSEFAYRGQFSHSPGRSSALCHHACVCWNGPSVPDTSLYTPVVASALGVIGHCCWDLESHGGLFPLHSHLNHACRPNVSIRHISSDGSTTSILHSPNPSRITAIATSRIPAGEELVVSYVDPSLGLQARRRELRAWDFGVCKCERCLEEEKVDSERPESHDSKAKVGDDGGKGPKDLEDEIRNFLGV